MKLSEGQYCEVETELHPIEVESATSELASQEVEPAYDGGTGDGR